MKFWLAFSIPFRFLKQCQPLVLTLNPNPRDLSRLWKKFSVKVIENYGGRSKNDVVSGLLSAYVSDPKVQKTVDEYLKS